MSQESELDLDLNLVTSEAHGLSAIAFAIPLASTSQNDSLEDNKLSSVLASVVWE